VDRGVAFAASDNLTVGGIEVDVELAVVAFANGVAVSVGAVVHHRENTVEGAEAADVAFALQQDLVIARLEVKVVLVVVALPEVKVAAGVASAL
jgi:hypothetical protein